MKTLETHTVEGLFDFDKEADEREVVLLADLHKAKIVIEVKGGCVQAVYITPELKAIPVILLDYDNEAQGDKFSSQQKQAELDIEQGKVKMIL